MKDKQIEEMAKIIGDNTGQDTMWPEIYDCAEALYNAGYRKASDVAMEIFAEIEEVVYKYLNVAAYSTGDMVYDLDELKKKYIGEDTNVTTKESEKNNDG
jgi:hypothetical protein